MGSALRTLRLTLPSLLRSNAGLRAEVLALRHQVTVLQRQLGGRRVRLERADRILWVLWLLRLWGDWRPPPVEAQHDDDEEDLEGDGRDDREVHGDRLVEVVGEEGPPALGRRSPPAEQVPGDRGPGHRDLELEEFTVDPGRSPGWVRVRHLPDEGTDLP